MAIVLTWIDGCRFSKAINGGIEPERRNQTMASIWHWPATIQLFNSASLCISLHLFAFLCISFYQTICSTETSQFLFDQATAFTLLHSFAYCLKGFKPLQIQCDKHRWAMSCILLGPIHVSVSMKLIVSCLVPFWCLAAWMATDLWAQYSILWQPAVTINHQRWDWIGAGSTETLPVWRKPCRCRPSNRWPLKRKMALHSLATTDDIWREQWKRFTCPRPILAQIGAPSRPAAHIRGVNEASGQPECHQTPRDGAIIRQKQHGHYHNGRGDAHAAQKKQPADIQFGEAHLDATMSHGRIRALLDRIWFTSSVTGSLAFLRLPPAPSGRPTEPVLRFLPPFRPTIIE